MRNKQLFITATALLMVSSCSDYLQTSDDATIVTAMVINWQDSITCYREKAREGDGNAYLQLASCYHEGYGVHHDFMMAYAMAKMAEQYGGLTKWEEFFLSMPADDPDRLTMEAMDDIGYLRRDEALQKADLLAAQKRPEADLIRGAVALEEGRKDEALRLFTLAAENGCPLAQMAVSVTEDVQKAKREFADRLPLIYCRLARECFETDDDSAKDERAAIYYRMADEHLCLDQYGVRWLLNYYEHWAKQGRPVADSLEIVRLRSLITKMPPRHRK